MNRSMLPTKSMRVFVSDCEGPISKNDNAFELASHFIPEGSRLFTLLSRYDDVLAEVVKRADYRAGDTLRLILPFLKAYSVTNNAMMQYSSKNVLLVSGAREMLQFVRANMPSFIVSTSYEQYMRVLCDTVDFPFEDVYCTQLDIDRFEIGQEEVKRLRRLREEMVNMPIPEIPRNAKSLRDLPERHLKTVKRLDQIFWKELPKMGIGRILTEVNPVGGAEKARALQAIVKRTNGGVHDMMYVGDSITDVRALRLVREAGGLAVSFNGNAYAVREADIAVLSEDAVATAFLADAFRRLGKIYVMKLARDWNPEIAGKLRLNWSLKERVKQLDGQAFRIEAVTKQNMKTLMQESTSFRKTVRGEAIGRLG